MVNKYYIERTLQALFTVFSVITITFGLVRLLPGGPVDYLRAQLAQGGNQISPGRLNALVEVYTNVNPSEPIYIQYVNYMGSLLQGDLGTSTYYSEPVMGILAAAAPWTIFVMSISLALTFGLGIVLGAIMAYIEGSRFDLVSSLTSIFLNSIPYYVMAVVLVFILGFQLNWFPTGGRVSSNATIGMNPEFLSSAVYHGTLPIISLVVTGFGIQALSMRGNSISVLGEDYVRVARLRGLPPQEIALRYVGRNAILPMYTGMMISIGFLFGGSVILEEIFSYPGIGYYMFRSIEARDYPLMTGAFLIITIAVVIGIYIADLTYGKLDPRAGSGGGDREAF